METLFIDNINKVRREKNSLEKDLNVKLEITGKKIVITGKSLEEYEATLVLEAIDFGYSPKDAILLKNEEYVFRKINIKDITRRKNLKEVIARLIGRHGQTRKTIEEITGCFIIIKDKEVGILGSAEEIEYAITGISNLIKGSKQSNVYSFLERINKNKTQPNK